MTVDAAKTPSKMAWRSVIVRQLAWAIASMVPACTNFPS